MGCTTLRQHTTFAVFFAESPVDVTPLQTKAMLSHSVASIEQASSGMQVTIAHERGPLSPCWDSRCSQEKHPRLYTGAVASERSLVLPGGNNRRSTETVFRWGESHEERHAVESTSTKTLSWATSLERRALGEHRDPHFDVALGLGSSEAARLPSELRTASVSDCFSWPEKSCAKPLLQKRTSNSPATPKGEQN
jgi:hypothetical protein